MRYVVLVIAEDMLISLNFAFQGSYYCRGVLLNSLNAMVQRTANENAAGIFLRDSFFVCPQSPYRDNDMILWIFPVVLCDAFACDIGQSAKFWF